MTSYCESFSLPGYPGNFKTRFTYDDPPDTSAFHKKFLGHSDDNNNNNDNDNKKRTLKGKLKTEKVTCYWIS